MSSFNDLPFFPTGSYAENGKDGSSPTISIKDISGGHTLTITDITGTKIVEVMDGKEGQQGEQGIQGPKGDKGDTGEQGPKGDTGAQGPQGEKGDKGDKGDTGSRGETGPAGKDGASAFEQAKTGGYTGTETEFNTALANMIDRRNITLGLHTDGLIYLFINNIPVGSGIALPSASINDIVGNIDSSNNISITGELGDDTQLNGLDLINNRPIPLGTYKIDTTIQTVDAGTFVDTTVVINTNK